MHVLLTQIYTFVTNHLMNHSFFFNDTATTEIYTLSLHDALPIYFLVKTSRGEHKARVVVIAIGLRGSPRRPDRKSTRLNSSHSSISYAVFCLKKKKNFILTHKKT